MEQSLRFAGFSSGQRPFLSLAQRTVFPKQCAFVMGIVNATPDSFWEGSRGGAEQALRLIEEGADILDIGGESTRPGSGYVDAQTEFSRIVPVIQEIRRHSDIPISVDTRKRSVMQAAFDAGADMLNDVSALEDDAHLAAWCAEKKIPVVLMHKRGIPAIMQENTQYGNVCAEVSAYLEERALYAMQQGIERGKIILDPGIGFGKNLAANISLMRACGKLCNGEFPVLMALSRKSCIGELTGRAVQDRLCGTLTADLLCVQSGAFMLRVHDVAAAVDSLAVLAALTCKRGSNSV